MELLAVLLVSLLLDHLALAVPAKHSFLPKLMALFMSHLLNWLKSRQKRILELRSKSRKLSKLVNLSPMRLCSDLLMLGSEWVTAELMAGYWMASLKLRRKLTSWGPCVSNHLLLFFSSKLKMSQFADWATEDLTHELAPYTMLRLTHLVVRLSVQPLSRDKRIASRLCVSATKLSIKTFPCWKRLSRINCLPQLVIKQ